MKPLKTKVSITLDTDVIETIKDLAENDDRSFSQYINLVLKDFLAQMNCQKKGMSNWFYPIKQGGLFPLLAGAAPPRVHKKQSRVYILYTLLCLINSVNLKLITF